MKISVIVVNYNTAELALAAVESVLARGHGGRAVDVHLVDNASPKGDSTALAAALAERGWCDRVRFYPEAANHGFGRGNNLVLERLAAAAEPPDYVFFLNPDAALKNETLDVLAGFLDDHPKAAVAGARLERPEGRAVEAAFRFPRIANEVGTSLAFGPVSRRLPTIMLPAELPTQQVDWVAGAAVMARFSALRDAGFFDPAYFLYYEEVDLMYRLKQSGWQVWFVDEAHATHIAGASTGMNTDRDTPITVPWYWYQSWYLYYAGNYGRGYAAATLMARLTASALHIVLRKLRGQRSDVPRYYFRYSLRHSALPLLGLGGRRKRSDV